MLHKNILLVTLMTFTASTALNASFEEPKTVIEKIKSFSISGKCKEMTNKAIDAYLKARK